MVTGGGDMKNNPNTSTFWDTYFIEHKGRISSKDYITLDRIKSVIGLIPNKKLKLLDVGLGYGFLERELYLSRRQVEIHGIDISYIGVANANKRYRGSFLVGSATNIPFRNNEFNYVCVLEVLEHLYAAQKTCVLREINRVLKHNGILIVSVPLYDQVYKGHPSGHVVTYTPQTIRSELLNAGYSIECTKALYAFRNYYKLKSAMNMLIKLKNPNNMIIAARKR